MTATVSRFISVLERMGSPVTFHREAGGTDCPCLSPEGYRDPQWHIDHPAEPVCNEEGKLASVIVNVQVKASVQPFRVGRLPERAVELVGEIQEDDHLGIFPVSWGGVTLDFTNWGEAGEDYILYDGRRFSVVNIDKIPDIDGDPNHHWEIGMRLIRTARP